MEIEDVEKWLKQNKAVHRAYKYTAKELGSYTKANLSRGLAIAYNWALGRKYTEELEYELGVNPKGRLAVVRGPTNRRFKGLGEGDRGGDNTTTDRTKRMKSNKYIHRKTKERERERNDKLKTESK